MVAQTVQLAAGNLGPVIKGGFGPYNVGSDGLLTVDTRDAPALIAAGASYVGKSNQSYQTPVAPTVATAGRFIASGALSNGSIAIANQPNVLRPGSMVIGPGTTGITAGTVTLVYTGNDGQTTTDVFSAITAASTNLTNYTSKGMAHIASCTVAGIVGGASPFIRLDSTADLSVPVAPGAVDFAVSKETTDAGDETVGALIANVLGTITPTTAPNSTHTYGFTYSFNAPN